jgi:hypothetical protein
MEEKRTHVAPLMRTPNEIEQFTANPEFCLILDNVRILTAFVVKGMVCFEGMFI